jgi:hypothetical protein
MRFHVYEQGGEPKVLDGARSFMKEMGITPEEFVSNSNFRRRCKRR